jgi:hypothetical protein
MTIHIYGEQPYLPERLLTPFSGFITQLALIPLSPGDIVYVKLWRKYRRGEYGHLRVQEREKLFLGIEEEQQRAWLRSLVANEINQPSVDVNMAWVRFSSESELATYNLHGRWLSAILESMVLPNLAGVGKRRRARWERAKA